MIVIHDISSSFLSEVQAVPLLRFVTSSEYSGVIALHNATSVTAADSLSWCGFRRIIHPKTSGTWHTMLACSPIYYP